MSVLARGAGTVTEPRDSVLASDYHVDTRARAQDTTGYYRRGGLRTGEKRPMQITDLREDVLVVVREFGGRLEKGAGHLHCSAFLVG